jgi:hypothetical protein
MKAEDPFAPAPPASDGGIAIHNRLPPGHRCRTVVDEVLHVALRGLSGSWDVSIHPVDRTWFRVDVVAPSGAAWSTSVRADEHWSAGDLADTVRAACVRHCRLKPVHAERRAGKPAEGSAANRDGSSQAGSQRSGLASVSSPAAPKGAPK